MNRIKLFVLFLIGFMILSVSGRVAYSGDEQYVYLPFVTFDEEIPFSQETTVEITPAGGITASTFEAGSFVIHSSALNTADISSVRIDLRTAVFPDMVFDPNGQAGDVIAKDVVVDSAGGTSYVGRNYAEPKDSGFSILDLVFLNFNPGETFQFSVDVDPTSIRGAAVPGPSESGSVSGIELIGSTVTVEYSNGEIHMGVVRRHGTSLSTGVALVRQGLPAPPAVSIAGLSSVPAVVSEASQTLVVEALPLREVTAVLIEGGQFTAGVPGGGFDIDPFEANSALGVFTLTAHTDGTGRAEISLNLLKSRPEGGFNHLIVMVEGRYGEPSLLSEPIVLQLEN